MGLALLSVFLIRVTILQPRPLREHSSACALSNLNLLSLMRRPLVSLLPKAQPYPAPFSDTAFLLLLSPSASLPRGTEVLPTHTLFLYHHSLLPLSPFPLHSLPAFALPRASLERFGPLGPTPTRRPTFCFGTHVQGLLGRGRKPASPPPPFSTLGQRATGSLLPPGGEDWPG